MSHATGPKMPPLYDIDDLVWCRRCQRPESVGAVLHTGGPYVRDNSLLLTPAAERRDRA